MYPLSSLRPSYADWKAPAEDAQTLIWPDPAELLQDALANNRHLRAADAARIQNVPLPELRRSLRAWLGESDDDKPIFATGHQTELYHAGVWAKNALIDAAATQLGGTAIHFAVDTDEPKHLLLRWPGGGMPLSDGPDNAAWSGLLHPPTPARINGVAQALDTAAAAWDFRPAAGDFLASLRRLSPEAETLPQALTAAMHELDWGLGLRHRAMLFSPLCLSEPFLACACHVLGRAEEFAADYNAALDDYRRENRIRTPGRPMPNLRVSDDACEVPFWLDSLAGGTRTRAWVHRHRDAWVLRLPDGAEFAFEPRATAGGIVPELARWTRQNKVRLAPRALTLTMFLRLLLADQFVHGIGGGRYDQVADALIARHFGVAPPRFAVTTATLYFPQAVGRPRVCMGCVLQEGHRLRHRVLGKEKDGLLAAIDAAPRGSVERSVLFHDMHRRLNAAADHPAVREWERQLEEAERRDAEEKDLFDRELFYALQPRERLQELIRQYRTPFSG
jgi:hypothetical protein